MSVQVKFYTILGKYEDFEQKLREMMLRIRDQVRVRGGDPDKINLTMIKVKEEALDLIYKYVKGETEPPEYLKSLIEHLKLDNVNVLPALIINGRKICEGDLIPIGELENIIIEEVRNVLGIDLREEPKKEILAEEKVSEVVPEVRPYETEEIQHVVPKPVIRGERREFRVERPVETVQRRPSVYIPTIGRGMPTNCGECIYYGFSTRYCFLLGRKVEDVTRPPCRRESL